MTDATMMDFPLTTQMILRRGERLFAQSRVSTFDGEQMHSLSFGEIADRARRLASALVSLGIGPGERVGTLCWNSGSHLVAYLAVPAIGRVLHTLNLRLFPRQIAWIAIHADDRAIIVDSDLLELLSSFAGEIGELKHVIVTDGGAGDALKGTGIAVHALDDLLADASPVEDWPSLEERDAAVMCYTSGTTGDPKGVVYSHRSIFLHSLASMGHDAFGIRNDDRVLMLPPMFHANAWGLPYSCWFAGADMVMPSRFLQPDAIRTIVGQSRPTLTMTVPTILNDLLQRHAREPMEMSSFRCIIAGGSAVSSHLIEQVKTQWGVDMIQGWGMTETSPMCVLSHPPCGTQPADEAPWRAKSGRPVAGMEVRIVDDNSMPVAQDGQSVGRLQVRGPWVTAGYHKAPQQTTPDGWFDTGDVGSIDPLGYVQITDRTKDLIKSGGEWISSVDLENELLALPGIAEAAVVAVSDPRWEERPLAIICWNGEEEPDYSMLRGVLRERLAKFMVPENWARLASLPKTSVGKIDKRALRDQVAGGHIDIVREHGFAAQDF
ncbi:MAG: long-chain-fatty-acid--CoA ligase [Novosphingobium sp.]